METFDDGPGGWYGWISNSAGPKPLEIRDGAALSRSPWWIDYNHAPPGVGYLHLLYMLNTGGKPGEHQREVQGENQFTAGGYPTDFTKARMTPRLKGEIEAKARSCCCSVRPCRAGSRSGWLLTGQPFAVTPDWSEQTVSLAPDPAQWTYALARAMTGPISMASCHSRRSWATSTPTSCWCLHPLDIAPYVP